MTRLFVEQPLALPGSAKNQFGKMRFTLHREDKGPGQGWRRRKEGAWDWSRLKGEGKDKVNQDPEGIHDVRASVKAEDIAERGPGPGLYTAFL